MDNNQVLDAVEMLEVASELLKNARRILEDNGFDTLSCSMPYESSNLTVHVHTGIIELANLIQTEPTEYKTAYYTEKRFVKGQVEYFQFKDKNDYRRRKYVESSK